ncbi:MAG: hypothetical protein WDA03_03175 [Trueperaceae bacterium]
MAQKPTKETIASAGKKATELPSPEEYAEFIQGIELVDVRLVNSDSNSSAYRPEAPELKLLVKYGSDIARVDSVEGYAFEAYPRLRVEAQKGDGDDLAGHVEVRFGLRYKSELEPTDGFLEIFTNVNLKVNAWPYLREYVHQTITRFGWTPLVLPVLKVAPARRPK